MKAHGTVYLGDWPLYRGTIRLAAGWVHVLDGDTNMNMSHNPFGEQQVALWEALERPVSVQAARIGRIEWSRKDKQIAGQLSMVEDAA